MIAEESEYKGSPVLIIKRNENDKYPVSFGLSKARLILDSIDEIKKFVQSYDVALSPENTSQDSIKPEKTDISTINTTREFVYDFCNPQSLENTCPIGLSYFGEELCSNPLSWQDLYGYFLTAISVDYPHIIEKFKGIKISNFQYPLISSFKDLIESNEICPVPFGKNDDTFTYVHINPNVLCRMIKTFLGLCNIDFENVRIQYEKQREFIAKEGERPPKYNENWIFFDFRNYYSFKSTNPVFCSINGKEINAPTWAKMFAVIIENELQKNNYALYFLYKNGMSLTTSGRNFFLKAHIPGLNCQKLSNGYYVNLNHDLPKMLELIKKFCLYCGYQPEQVKIYGIAKGNITMQPNLPDFIPAQSNVVNFYNLGSFAHTKPLKATYNGNNIECKSWRGLFVNIVKKLFEIYPDKFRKDINRNVYRAYYSNSGLLYPDEEGLIAPEQIYFDIFIEAHHSATDTVEQIRCFLDLCDEKYESLRIEYYYTQNNPGLFVPVINTTYSDELISAASNILSVEFPNGMRLNSTIAQKKFLEAYRKFSGHQLEDAIDIDSLVLQAGIEVDGKVYYVSENARNEIKELAENAFESGSNVIFYEQLYSQNSNLLQEYEIYSSSMLKKILQQVLPNLQYDNDSFCEEGKTLEDDIIRCFGSNIIMPLSDIQYKLPYASPDAVKDEIRKNDSFIYINQNECILSSAIDIYEDDVYSTESNIEQEIQKQGFSSMQSIDITNTEDKNAGIPGDALREAIFNKYLKDKYSRKGSVISPLNEKTGIADRLKELCASREKITLSELQDYEKSINGSNINSLRIACKCLIRVNTAEFVSKDIINFNVDDTDNAIDSFTQGNIISVRKIDSFTSFPYLENYPWNEFLLSAYCEHKSRNFTFFGFNTINDIAGAIVSKAMANKFNNYDDVLAYLIAKSDIDISNEQDIIDFLVENGYRLRAKKLNSSIIQKAAAIRIEEK